MRHSIALLGVISAIILTASSTHALGEAFVRTPYVSFSASAREAYSEYVYYGFAPLRVFYNRSSLALLAGGWGGMFGTAEGGLEYNASEAILVLLGNVDDTRCQVYDLSSRGLLRDVSLDKLEHVTLRLTLGTFFKVVANKPVTVMLLGGTPLEEGEAMISTFYTSVEGGYVGKEFIFMDVESKMLQQSWLPYRIYTVEDSEVTIEDANGTKVSSFQLPVNQVKELSLTPFRVYRLVSTGNVMLQSFALWTIFNGHVRHGRASCFYPALEGGFVGKHFYGSGVGLGWFPSVTFIATSGEEARMKVFDLQNRKLVNDTGVKAGSFFFEPPKEVAHLFVESGQPMMLMFKTDDALDGGVGFTGLRAGQTAYLYVPVGETYVFSESDATVTVDDTLRLSVKVDEPLRLWQGLHKLATTENLVIQVVNLAEDQGLASFGSVIPPIQSVSISNEDVRIRPFTAGEEIPWTYLIVGVAVLCVAAVLGWVKKRRRP